MIYLFLLTYRTQQGSSLLINITIVLCRTTLGFWAGHRNSKIRVILARVWENDTELDISNNRINRAMGPLLYQKRFYRTKFCICPGGSQVNSARIADSIHYGCVPGKISMLLGCLYERGTDGFLPFSLIKCMVNMDVGTICVDVWVNRDELKTSWLSQIMLFIH